MFNDSYCCSCSVTQSYPTLVNPWTAAPQAFLAFNISHSLLKLMSIELVMPSNHLILCCPLLLLPSIFPSIRVISNESALYIRWPKLEFQLQHQSFQWIFRVDVLYDWLVWSPCFPRDFQESSPVPQFESVSSSALCFLHCPALTFVHDYWKDYSLDYVDISLVSKVMSLLFNTLSRFVIAFLPTTNGLLISWLQSPSTVIMEIVKYNLEYGIVVVLLNPMGILNILSWKPKVFPKHPCDSKWYKLVSDRFCYLLFENFIYRRLYFWMDFDKRVKWSECLWKTMAPGPSRPAFEFCK